MDTRDLEHHLWNLQATIPVLPLPPRSQKSLGKLRRNADLFRCPKFSYAPLVWAPDLDPNIYQIYAIFKRGAHRSDPTRIKGAHNKGP